MNGRPIPADLRIPVTEADFRLFRLEQGVLTLGSNRRFTLHFWYYHQLVRRGTRPTSSPVMSDSETGTYSFSKGQLILTPKKKKGDPARPAIAAAIAGEEIRASYLLQDAVANERIALVLRRDASYW